MVWCGVFRCVFFFFFKQKTAYEMRISDWSSDVCSSDLCTFYTPYVHDLVKLRGQAELVDARLREAWPRDKAEDVDAFEMLQQAYVKARYLKDFHVAADKLDWLGARTKILAARVKTICDERIAELERAARTHLDRKRGG